MMSTTRVRPLPASRCPCTGATLDKLLQPAILTILAQEPLHGYRIAQRVAHMPPFGGQKPDASGVYRSLRAMESRGLVVASWDVSGRGPARRLYELTPDGHACLARWIRTLADYRRAVGELLALARHAAEGAQGGRRPPR